MKKALFILLFMIGFNGWAHEIRPAFLQIIQTSETTYEVFWKIPSMGDAVPKIHPVFPPFFTVEELKRPNQTILKITLYEGRNRQIRKMFKSLNLKFHTNDNPILYQNC